MATKELLTRIALKYDTYANWTDTSKAGQGGNLVLLRGEIGLCEIPSGNTTATNAPTVLFKVGNGETAFSGLKWASATAADVHEWAKAETVVLTGEVLQFKTGNSVKHSVDLSKFATNAELEDAVARIAAIEGSIGSGGSVANDIAALDARLDTIESTDATKAGSIAKAKADAIAAAATDATTKANTAETNAKTHANTEIAKDRTRLDALEEADEDLAADIAENATAIATEKSARETAVSNLDTAYKAADKAINDKIGTVSNGKTVVGMISDAQNAAATDATNKVNALKNGEVKANTDAIAENAGEIASLKTSVANEIAARQEADNALDERIDKLETFFAGADADGESGGLYDALDTLTEIQKFITDEGSAADQMLEDITANTNAITALQNIVNDGGTLEVRVDSAESKITAAQSKITALENVTKGYSGVNAISDAVEAVNGKAVAAQAAAGNAQSAADKAQGDIDALELVVNDESTGLAAVNTKASTNTSDIANLKSRMTTAEGDIDSLEAIVKTGDDANTKLRTAITTLQELTGHANKGNEALRSELTTIQNVVNNATTGLAATKGIADDAKAQAETNKTDIAAIKADYLKAADAYIFNCGSATVAIHEA